MRSKITLTQEVEVGLLSKGAAHPVLAGLLIMC
jgi:hypothetical protein